MTPPSRILYGKIGLPVHATYRFVGYQTSILRHLIDCGEETVKGHQSGFTIQISVNSVMKSATEEIVGAVQSAALGVAGEVVSMVGTMGTVLDGISVLGMAGGMLPEGERPELKRPGKAAYHKDHLMNDRIIVDVTMHKGDRTGWVDTGKQEITLKDVAYVVHDH